MRRLIRRRLGVDSDRFGPPATAERSIRGKRDGDYSGQGCDAIEGLAIEGDEAWIRGAALTGVNNKDAFVTKSGINVAEALEACDEESSADQKEDREVDPRGIAFLRSRCSTTTRIE